jgi:hypothetical protein
VESGVREAFAVAAMNPHATNGSSRPVLLDLSETAVYTELLTASLDASLDTRRQRTVTPVLLNGAITSIRQDLAQLQQLMHSGTNVTIAVPASNDWCAPSTTNPLNLTSTAALFAAACVITLGANRSSSFAGQHNEAHRCTHCYSSASPHSGPMAWYRHVVAMEALANRRRATIFLTFNQDHLEFLINARKRLLIFALFVKLLSVKMLAHAYHVVCNALAIIAVFMSHRHRHEPSDTWLLSRTPIPSLAGCSSQ